MREILHLQFALWLSEKRLLQIVGVREEMERRICNNGGIHAWALEVEPEMPKY